MTSPRGMGGRRRRGALVAAIAAVVAVIVAALSCSGGDGDSDDRADDVPEGPGPVESGPPVELRVLAGSELEDMEPILAEAAEATGVTVRFELTGTLEGVERLVAGEAEGSFDALWFPSNRYLALHPEADVLRREERIMTSPVVLGLATATARELGWDDGAEVTWSDIATAAADGRFTYGMANPAESNSGFSALVGVAAALADTGAALELDDVESVAGELRGFFSAQALTAGSSGWLSEAFAARASGQEPGRAVDGLINYESVLLSLNDGDRLPERLTVVTPTDGVVTADYPLSLLRSATEEAADGYDRLVAYLLRPEVQADIMERTHRRPVLPEVELGDGFGSTRLVELPFPARLDVVDGLIDAFFDRLRRPVRTVYVLDVSGSMEGERIAGLRRALTGLTGADDTLSSRARQFHSREEITLLPFDTAPRPVQTFVVPEDGADQARAQLRTAAEGLTTGGDTAVYDALTAAYDLLGRAEPGDHAVSIVLMTDGESNTGATYDQFVQQHAGLPEDLRTVPVFTVLFGEANTAQMEQVAALTGGRAFDARSGGLAAAFGDIRGYQ